MNEQPELVDSVLEGRDDVAEQSKDDGAQSLRIPEAVSDSDDGPESVNVSLDTTTGHSDEAGIGSAMCRICHDGDEEEPLVSPCKCSGSIRFVHVSCIEHWLNEMNVDICELCGQRFQMAAQPGIAMQFLHWISLREAQLQRALLRDVLVWAMMTAGTLIALAIMLQATRYVTFVPGLEGISSVSPDFSSIYRKSRHSWPSTTQRHAGGRRASGVRLASPSLAWRQQHR
ncbi:hypothetical protein HPB50_013199 [Hyalomma asiaticum]|uniref:Uncharacterized protein n=1 Tax=Hyalomma asiaticum TaxID=266040 RepID=A0ACB7THF9_HYAAI|nr:hypothetical protein HPB50_013199 [Hyalomma asiaticum]